MVDADIFLQIVDIFLQRVDIFLQIVDICRYLIWMVDEWMC